MNTIIALCAILGGTFGLPFGGYPAPGPYIKPTPTVSISAPKAYGAVQVRPVFSTSPAVTGTLTHSQDTYGQYSFTYSSSDGQDKTESRQADGSVTGRFSYMSPEGVPIALTYTANHDGFHPHGNHLPVAPEVPPMPADLAQAYRESNERLAQAYEEARLRGDTEFSDDGSYKQEAELPRNPNAYYNLEVEIRKPPTLYYKKQVVVPKPVAPIYKAPAVTYKNIAKPVPSVPAITHATYEAPRKSIYSVPAAPAPVQHSSTSYSTEIGGTPLATVYEPVPIQREPAAKSGYAFTIPKLTAGYTY